MENQDQIINKVANSGLITIDLNDFLKDETIVSLDIKDQLWQELVLKEKDFREYIRNHPWENYLNKNVAVFCSADAIIPTWAFMLLSSALQPFARNVFFGDENALREKLILQKINLLPAEKFLDARVIVKGCSDFELSPEVYMQMVIKLQPLVKSLMFGEPCSTVPVYKKK